MMPPRSTPATPPNPAIPPHTPSARLRSGPSANVVTRIDRAAGAMIAAPMPWMARAAIRMPLVVARPHVSEAAENTTSPIRNIRLRPSRSAARPPRRSSPPYPRT
jgi:hypothetical protein